MSIANPDPSDAEDADVPQLAVDALNAATQRSLGSGQSVVLVRDNKLVQITNGEVIELEEAAPWPKVEDVVGTTE